MHLKVNSKNHASWLISLNLSYSDCIARLAYQKFILNNSKPKLVAFSSVIKKVKNEFNCRNIETDIDYVNPFKFLFLKKYQIKEVQFVSPSVLSIFFIIFFKIRQIKIISIIHNHPTFKADNLIFKLLIGRMIEILSILISDKVIFTAPHIKSKWEKSNIFRIFKFSSKCKSFKRIFAFEDGSLENDRTTNNYRLSQTLFKEIDIYSWGRSTPYKDLKILLRIFDIAPTYLKNRLRINIIHYGKISSRTIFENDKNSNAQISIINNRPSFQEIEYIHNDADYIIFPYTDMSQSGPMRLSMEYGSTILVPKLDGSIDQLSNYKNKFLFNPDNLETLFQFLMRKLSD